VDAQEAYRIGLANRIVPGPEFEALLGDMVHEMASKGPISLAYSKEAINKGMDLSLEQGLRLEADLYFLIHSTEDRREGIKAFQEKRPAQFEGR
jgi:enoyl-CoA hydratase/carnithine racemase